MSNLCKSVAALIQAVAGSLHPLITTRSTTGEARYYKPSADTPVLRSALLVTAVQQARTNDVIKLEAGAFVIEASLLSQIQPGVTGVTIVYGPGVTYHYTNNEHSIPDYPLFPWPQPVGDLVQLQSAISGVTASLRDREITLVRDITVTGSLLIPRPKTITPAEHLFVKGSGGAITFLGYLNQEPQQVFSGFGIGEVVGNFRNEYTYPEWWGLIANNHDIAINCAVSSSSLLSQNFGCKVKLSPGTYYVSKDIDMSDRGVTLEGSGSILTNIETTREWTDRNWLKCEQWGDPADLTPNHGSVIWMGSALGSYNSYRTRVMGISISGAYASYTHWGVKRVSCISSRFGIEENSIIQDVVAAGFTGFGIGFDRHYNPANSTWYPATVNGLDISSSWVMGSMMRDSRPVYFSTWTNNCQFRTSTVDVGVSKSESSLYGTGGSAGGSDPATYPAPEHIRDWPAFAIIAKGNVTITDIHVEGAGVGVLIPEDVGASNIHVNSLKCFALMDRARNAVYELDGFSGAEVADNNGSGVYDYACCVLIAGYKEGVFADRQSWKGNATLTNVSCLGSCAYLLRDDVFGIHRQIYDVGQFSNGELGGRFAFYTRGNAWIVAGSDPPQIYNPATPPSDRTYFIGPIY